MMENVEVWKSLEVFRHIQVVSWGPTISCRLKLTWFKNLIWYLCKLRPFLQFLQFPMASFLIVFSTLLWIHSASSKHKVHFLQICHWFSSFSEELRGYGRGYIPYNTTNILVTSSTPHFTYSKHAWQAYHFQWSSIWRGQDSRQDLVSR